ncbi:hypothetical protein FOZ63_023214, partial [Perkinsus olseni]
DSVAQASTPCPYSVHRQHNKQSSETDSEVTRLHPHKHARHTSNGSGVIRVIHHTEGIPESLEMQSESGSEHLVSPAGIHQDNGGQGGIVFEEREDDPPKDVIILYNPNETDPHCFVSSPSESLSSGIVGVTGKGSVDEAQPTSSEDENEEDRMRLLANPLGAYPRSLPPPKSSPDRSVVSLPAPSPCDAQPPRRASDTSDDRLQFCRSFKCRQRGQ